MSIEQAINKLSKGYAGLTAGRPSRSLNDEFKRLNKKHGKKTFQKPCLGAEFCDNLLCDHKYAPKGASTAAG